MSSLTSWKPLKLLQLLQSRTYYPLGSTKALTANVRIIAATNVDLKRAVTDKRFREDLFYRLQVLPIRVPSLAERRDDIPELVRFFSAQAAATLDLPHVEPSAQALRAAVAAEWPGNVRQLAHAVQAAVITAAGSSLLQFEPAHLGLEPMSAPGSERTELSFQQLTFRFQGRILKDTLERTGWNVVETAERLDLTRSHVYNLIRSHGLERP